MWPEDVDERQECGGMPRHEQGKARRSSRAIGLLLVRQRSLVILDVRIAVSGTSRC